MLFGSSRKLSESLNTKNRRISSDVSVDKSAIEKKTINFCVADVIFSALGTVVWIAAIVTWVVVFQVNRASWGKFADDISFIIPLGTP